MALDNLSEMEGLLVLSHRLKRAARQADILAQLLWDDGKARHEREKDNVYGALMDVKAAYKAMTGVSV